MQGFVSFINFFKVFCVLANKVLTLKLMFTKREILPTEKQKISISAQQGPLLDSNVVVANVETIERQGVLTINHQPSTQKYPSFTTTWPNDLQPFLF